MDAFGFRRTYASVHIRNQQRNGKKTLTTVQGLEKDLDLRKILRYLRKLLSTNGTIVKDDMYGEVLQLQGLHSFLFVIFFLKNENTHIKKKIQQI